MELRSTYKGGGGPDKTILLSAKKHNKDKFFILVTYLRDPDDNDFQIGSIARKLGITDYVEIIDRRKLDFKCLFELNRLLKRNDIQVIHVHDQKTILLGALLKLLNPRVKLLNTAHGWMINSDFDKLKQKIEFLILCLYPLHIAVSEDTKKLLVESGIDPRKIKVLYNSIDTAFWKKTASLSTVRNEFGISHVSLVVGTIGRLSKEKDLPTFLQVARNVLNIYPDSFFLVVGDGKEDELSCLWDLAKNKGIEKAVIFTGHRSDLRNIYSSLDLFLTTSLTEGLPNAVLEAMAMEVPVVATRAGGVPELIEDGRTGFLCDKGDVKGITNAVIEIGRAHV